MVVERVPKEPKELPKLEPMADPMLAPQEVPPSPFTQQDLDQNVKLWAVDEFLEGANEDPDDYPPMPYYGHEHLHQLRPPSYQEEQAILQHQAAMIAAMKAQFGYESDDEPFQAGGFQAPPSSPTSSSSPASFGNFPRSQESLSSLGSRFQHSPPREFPLSQPSTSSLGSYQMSPSMSGAFSQSQSLPRSQTMESMESYWSPPQRSGQFGRPSTSSLGSFQNTSPMSDSRSGLGQPRRSTGSSPRGSPLPQQPMESMESYWSPSQRSGQFGRPSTSSLGSFQTSSPLSGLFSQPSDSRSGLGQPRRSTGSSPRGSPLPQQPMESMESYWSPPQRSGQFGQSSTSSLGSFQTSSPLSGLFSQPSGSRSSLSPPRRLSGSSPTSPRPTSPRLQRLPMPPQNWLRPNPPQGPSHPRNQYPRDRQM